MCVLYGGKGLSLAEKQLEPWIAAAAARSSRLFLCSLDLDSALCDAIVWTMYEIVKLVLIGIGISPSRFRTAMKSPVRVPAPGWCSIVSFPSNRKSCRMGLFVVCELNRKIRVDRYLWIDHFCSIRGAHAVIE